MILSPSEPNKKMIPLRPIDLIPHRSPIIMLDALVFSEDSLFKSVFKLRKDNIFLSDGHILEAGLLENIAQTAAAGVGFQYRLRDQEIPTGFIGAVQKLTISSLPGEGALLETTVEVKHKVMNFSVIRGQVHVTGDLAAECEMKLFLQEI